MTNPTASEIAENVATTAWAETGDNSLLVVGIAVVVVLGVGAVLAYTLLKRNNEKKK